MKRIAIIGAGISGLSCALRLEELRKQYGADLEISVYDSSSRAGGAIETESIDGFTLEKGPDSFISEKPWVLDLCKKLGIGSEVLDTRRENRKVFVVKGNRLISLPEGFYLIAPTRMVALAATPLFSILGKLRMGCELFVPKRSSDDDESIASFIRRRFGREALDRVGQPMIAGIYSGDPEQLSLSATMPRFRELERQHGSIIRGLIKNAGAHKVGQEVSGPRYGLFLSFRQGMETLVRSICSHLPKATFHFNAQVKIEGTDPSGRWVLIDQDGDRRSFDALCLSVSARQTAALIRNMDAVLAEELGHIRFESVATLNLAYKEEQIPRPLSGFGFVVPAIEKRSLTACTFVSQKYQDRAPKGYVLLRAFVGGAFGKEFFRMDDKDLKRAVVNDLKELLGIQAEPCFDRIARYSNLLPQYGIDHQQWASRIDKSVGQHSGLFLIGASYRGTGIANCVKEAELQADKIYSELFA